MAKLSESEIQQALDGLDGWENRDGALQRQFTFPTFQDAIAFVNRVATLAEQADHHPDIIINYNRVGIALSSHDAGGVTDRDTALAPRIEAVADGMG